METELTLFNQQQPRAITSTDYKAVIELFGSEQVNLKANSRELYRRTLVVFFDWVKKSQRDTQRLTIQDIKAYREDLLAAGKSSLTVANYINSVRRFFEWAEANKLYPNIARGVKAPKRKQEFRKQPLSAPKIGELIRYERDSQSARDFAIVNLMLYTGLRCVEVVRANIEDITYRATETGEQRILVVRGKGRDDKDSFVVLTPAAYEPIRAYLAQRGATPISAPLFAASCNRNNGGRLTTRSVSRIAKNGLRSVGLDNHVYTAHSLRHTAGTSILRAGGSLEMAQFALRHANPSTTEIYTSTIRDERRLQSGGEFLLDKYYSTVI